MFGTCTVGKPPVDHGDVQLPVDPPLDSSPRGDVEPPVDHGDVQLPVDPPLDSSPRGDVQLPVDPPLEMVEGHTAVEDRPTPSIGLSLFYGSRRDYVKRNRPVPKPKTADINVYEPAQKKRMGCL